MRRSATSGRQVPDPEDRLADLYRRADRLDQLAAEASERAMAAERRQAAVEADLANVPVILTALANQLTALDARTSTVPATAERVDTLQRQVSGLLNEVETAGALAATAVAACDEIQALTTGLRELRSELLRLAREVRCTLAEPAAPPTTGDDRDRAG